MPPAEVTLPVKPPSSTGVALFDVVAGGFLLWLTWSADTGTMSDRNAILIGPAGLLLIIAGMLIFMRIRVSTALLAWLVNGVVSIIGLIWPFQFGKYLIFIIYGSFPYVAAYFVIWIAFVMASRQSLRLLRFAHRAEQVPSAPTPTDDLEVAPGWDEAAAKNHPKPPAPADHKNPPNNPPPE
jgi:hypothetical protein